MKYIIRDWADNLCFNGKEFASFELAWEFLYEHFRHLSGREFIEQMEEFCVLERDGE